jgi:hypothetical protein
LLQASSLTMRSIEPISAIAPLKGSAQYGDFKRPTILPQIWGRHRLSD